MIQLNLIEIYSIIFLHWIFDFVLQTDKQAKGKSKNWNDLLSHTSNYSLMWAFPIIIGSNYLNYSDNMILFIPITFICHTITDYFTSRLNSKLWEQGKVHNFFISIGWDQCLHYFQLFLTYVLLKQYL